jgi:hypothetical protein
LIFNSNSEYITPSFVREGDVLEILGSHSFRKEFCSLATFQGTRESDGATKMMLLGEMLFVSKIESGRNEDEIFAYVIGREINCWIKVALCDKENNDIRALARMPIIRTFSFDLSLRVVSKI